MFIFPQYKNYDKQFINQLVPLQATEHEVFNQDTSPFAVYMSVLKSPRTHNFHCKFCYI